MGVMDTETGLAAERQPGRLPLPAEDLLELYRRMVMIRRFEETVFDVYRKGWMPGLAHLSDGQEAVPVGVCAALHQDDTITSTHRGHGHIIAKGGRIGPMMAEVMGKASGYCRGKGGEMHIADVSLGILGANGIVGGGMSLALGSAMAHRTRKTGGVAVAFFGDGAMAEGALHECLNMAALWRLPLVFVCENNGWSEFSPTARQFAATLEKLGAAFGIPHSRIDGNDITETAPAGRAVIEAARADGPRILECITTRWHGHFEGDPQRYRDEAELAALTANDPLQRSLQALRAAGVAEAAIEAATAEVDAAIEAAIATARTDAEPDFAAAMRDVYTTGAGA